MAAEINNKSISKQTLSLNESLKENNSFSNANLSNKKTSFLPPKNIMPLVFDVPFSLTSVLDLNQAHSLNLDKVIHFIYQFQKILKRPTKKLIIKKELCNIKEKKDDYLFIKNKRDFSKHKTNLKLNKLSIAEKNIIKFYQNQAYFNTEIYHRFYGNLIYDLRLSLNLPVGIVITSSLKENSNENTVTSLLDINSSLKSTSISLFNKNNLCRLLQLDSFESVDSLSEVFCIRE